MSRSKAETTLLSAEEFADASVADIENGRARIGRLALVIPGYNESEVIGYTIQSAIDAGQPPSSIYVVDDCSSDKTAEIAKRILGPHNVITVGRSGKGLAISKVVSQLKLTRRYRWIHIADADGAFSDRYFTTLRRDIRVKNAAATGYVKSLPGGYISKYRVFEYTIGMDIIRRFQSIAGVITIVPGPTSIFRNDIFEQLNFNDNALCEDFDVTLQIHRNKMGAIQFIPEAVALTQDPATFKDYIKQITRWNRGVMQMFFKHGIGKTMSKVDTYLIYQVMQNLLFFAMYFLYIPIISILSEDVTYLALAFVSDVLIMFGFTLFAAMRANRMGIVGAFPIIYGLRWVSLFIFLRSFVEVVVLKRFRNSHGIWETVARRSQTTN